MSTSSSHNYKKRILIIGPIASSGGRTVEVNHVAKALHEKYEVQIISTEYVKENSFYNFHSRTAPTSIDQILFKKYLLLRIAASLSHWKNKTAVEPHGYTNNIFSKKFLDYEQKRKKLLFEVIENSDLVILTIQLYSLFSKTIIERCHLKKIPCLVRITGTVQVDANHLDYLKKVSLFLHHSKTNAMRLKKYLGVPYQIIDQSALEEQSLLSLPLEKKFPLTFGFLGRFSQEKGALELSEYFAKSRDKFLMAGNGPLKEKILGNIDGNKNCQYLGYILPYQKKDFFENIDVLIISSYEEAGPYTGLEAMAAGKIIISTKVGAMKERMRSTDNNFWFDINDLSTLDQAVSRLQRLNEESLILISQKLRSKYKKFYSEETVSKLYLNLTDEILNKKNF